MKVSKQAIVVCDATTNRKGHAFMALEPRLCNLRRQAMVVDKCLKDDMPPFKTQKECDDYELFCCVTLQLCDAVNALRDDYYRIWNECCGNKRMIEIIQSV